MPPAAELVKEAEAEYKRESLRCSKADTLTAVVTPTGIAAIVTERIAAAYPSSEAVK